MIEFWYFPLEASLYHQRHTEIAIISGGAIDLFMLFIYNLSIKVQLRLSLDTHTQKHLSTHPIENENLLLHLFDGSVCFLVQLWLIFFLGEGDHLSREKQFLQSKPFRHGAF